MRILDLGPGKPVRISAARCRTPADLEEPLDLEVRVCLNYTLCAMGR